ncbi:glycosyltransferase family 2 protein [Pseudomarimonas arenosa]|uniref:glycosyltransferase family 2 protein n=1 Tax=Pseudomarimonas arenosa TaxID=2774145 RepID=UPI002FC3054D
MKTLYVIPAFNEEGSIGILLKHLRSAPRDCVLVVSDASTDQTAAIARAAGAEVLELPLQLGAWGATQAGLRFALRHGYDRVITLDADGQHDPQSIPDLTAAQLRSSADVIIGTFPKRLSRSRQLAWHWFRALSGLRVEDLTSGFRLYSRRAIRVLASAEATLLDYQDVGVLLLARRYGLSIREVPVTMHPRHDGRSRVFASWFIVAGYMAQTTLLCLARVGRWPTAKALQNEISV